MTCKGFDGFLGRCRNPDAQGVVRLRWLRRSSLRRTFDEIDTGRKGFVTEGDLGCYARRHGLPGEYVPAFMAAVAAKEAAAAKRGGGGASADTAASAPPQQERIQ